MMIDDYTICGWQRALEGEMSGPEFEQFCAEVLCAAGFYRADTTPPSNDGGIDIIAVKDGVSYAIQCKRQKGQVGPGVIRSTKGSRDFYGSCGCPCDYAVVMTCSSFTDRARATAEALGVLMWDRKWIEDTADDTGVTLL